MEPRMLMIDNGSLSAAKGKERQRRSVSAETFTDKMREELIYTPVRGLSFAQATKANEKFSTSPSDNGKQEDINDGPEDQEIDDDTEIHHTPQQTPTGYVKYDPATDMSPATPYLLNQANRLVQMSCPPKQTGQGLFGNEERQMMMEEGGDELAKRNNYDEGMRRRLEAVRRKTMQGWKPKVGSPLGR